MIDAHAHLDFDAFDGDRQAVIDRAFAAGLTAIVTIGIDAATSRAAARIAAGDERIFATAGIHPHDAAGCDEAAFAVVRGLLESDANVVALGEVGLDFFKEYSPRDVQEHWFRRFLHLAAETDKPLVIHCRDAHERALAILREEGLAPYRGMFHCFSAGPGIAREVLDLGFDLSFTGTITYTKSVAVRESLALAPPDRFHVETDCPFLAPVPHRGKRNEPAYVARVLEAAARVRGIAVEEADRLTEANTRRLFGLP